MLSDIIVSDLRVPAPPELIEHLYKKEYGLTTYEFLNEPADRIGFFLKVKEMESIREEMDSKERQHG